MLLNLHVTSLSDLNVLFTFEVNRAYIPYGNVHHKYTWATYNKYYWQCLKFLIMSNVIPFTFSVTKNLK